jgi:hypothetical protein
VTDRTITVKFYSGSKAEERPRIVVIDGREYRVKRLISEQLERVLNSNAEIRRYRVLTECGRIFDIAKYPDARWVIYD